MHNGSGLCNGCVQSKNRFVRSGAAGQRKYDNRRFPPTWSVEACRPLDLVGAIRNACQLPWSLHPADSPGTVSSAHLHRAHRAKGNDDGQDTRIGLRAGGCRDHAQGQARHTTGPAAPRAGNRATHLQQLRGRAGAALSAISSRRLPAAVVSRGNAQAADQSFSLLTWRIMTLHSCVGAAVNGFRGCRECRSCGRRGCCGAWESWRMHGRNRTVAPAILAHIKMRRLGKFGQCLAFRHASWRAKSQ
jgi:hypothetical protein